MGNITTQSEDKVLETALVACTNQDDILLLRCDPPVNNSYEIYLNKSHPNYVNLNNTIDLGKSFKITYYSTAIVDYFIKYHIKDIQPCDDHVLTTTIKSLINMGLINSDLFGYFEAVCEPNINLRFMVKQRVPINKSCVITYKKFYAANWYLITNIL